MDADQTAQPPIPAPPLPESYILPTQLLEKWLALTTVATLGALITLAPKLQKLLGVG